MYVYSWSVCVLSNLCVHLTLSVFTCVSDCLCPICVYSAVNLSLYLSLSFTQRIYIGRSIYITLSLSLYRERKHAVKEASRTDCIFANAELVEHMLDMFDLERR